MEYFYPGFYQARSRKSYLVISICSIQVSILFIARNRSTVADVSMVSERVTIETCLHGQVRDLGLQPGEVRHSWVGCTQPQLQGNPGEVAVVSHPSTYREYLIASSG